MTKVKISPIPANNLLTIKEAAERLGQNYSDRSIHRLIESGEWQEGIHWINQARATAKNRRIKINIAEAEKYAGISAAYR